MARSSRTAIRENDPTYLWKAILRLLAIVLAIIGIATIGWALTHRQVPTAENRDSDYYNSYSYSGSYFADFLTLPWSFITLGLSIIWNIANLAVLLSRNRPIHPGANVGCDLVLWLALIVTGTAAVFGSADYFYYYPGSYTSYSSYGGSSSSSSGADDCDGFDTCGERDQYVKFLQHKGTVIAVGCAMSFVVLLFHFALFISACRYTHARRHGVNSKHAKAITTEATEIAQKMIADMTGPDGAFRPRSRQGQPHTGPSMAPDLEMQQASRSQPTGSSTNQPYHSPEPSGAVNTLSQRRYSPEPTVAEGSNGAINRGAPQTTAGRHDVVATHPALRAT